MSPPSASALLEIRGLGVAVGRLLSSARKVILDDVSLDVARGEIVALVGESGSGKTTLARALVGLPPAPTSGSIKIAGERLPARPDRAARRRVQLVFQDPFASLNPAHKVGHHVERPLIVHGHARRGAEAAAQAIALLDAVGLPGRELAARFPHELSGGQRQRVAIARALAARPELLVADEPTSMLDASVRLGVLDLFAQLVRERHLGLLVITHDLAVARHVADRVVVLYAGRVVESGPAAAVLSAPQHPYTQLLVAAAPDPDADPRRPLPVRPADGAAPASGCAFAPRCPKVHDRCRRDAPTLIDVGPRAARCHLA